MTTVYEGEIKRRSIWQERMGVGERQANDIHVADQSRVKRLIIPGEHHPQAAKLVLHKSGRVDATVTPQPVNISRDEIKQVQKDLGVDDREMLRALNRIFGTRSKEIRYARR